MIKLTRRQRLALPAVEWFLSVDGRGHNGRTFLAIVVAVRQALREPGTAVRVCNPSDELMLFDKARNLVKYLGAETFLLVTQNRSQVWIKDCSRQGEACGATVYARSRVRETLLHLLGPEDDTFQQTESDRDEMLGARASLSHATAVTCESCVYRKLLCDGPPADWRDKNSCPYFWDGGKAKLAPPRLPVCCKDAALERYQGIGENACETVAFTCSCGRSWTVTADRCVKLIDEIWTAQQPEASKASPSDSRDGAVSHP